MTSLDEGPPSDPERFDHDIIGERSDDGLLLWHVGEQRRIELDDMGATFWDALDVGGSAEAALRRLGDLFDVEPATIRTDLEWFERRLGDAGIGRNGRPSSIRIEDRYVDLVERALVGFLDPTTALLPSTSGAYHTDTIEALPTMTMLGALRIRNVRNLTERAIDEGVPGDFIECGVWRGGAMMLVAAVLAAHRIDDRLVWLADSFAGLPGTDLERRPVDHTWAGQDGWLAVSAAEVASNFRRFGLLDDRVRFLEGWFAETLPTAPIDRLALLRVDGDLYESVWDTLEHLHHRVSPGGFVIVDDYSIDSCRAAVDDFRTQNGITAPMTWVDWSAVWWQVPKPS